jgi:tRNA U34 5-methylaminomethyl-2-thiouridine-forming methyltransferase MnmC
LKRKIVKTDDGSSTIHLTEWGENYHSKFGAIQEAYHVFIKSGLDLFADNSKVSLLEIGFGTGLNCFITYLESKKRNLKINYEGVDAYPLTLNEISQLNYIEKLDAHKFGDLFNKIHEVSWDKGYQIDLDFILKKRKQFFSDISDMKRFDLIYFDAFGANVQPELWTEEIFKKMFRALKDDGVLVTYSAKGSVRRAMQAVGLTVEKLPGPPGKREMLRGKKIENQRFKI